MNRRRYSEDQSVQKPAAQLLAGMGWRSVVAFNDEDFGPQSLLGRANRSEWALTRHLRAALVRLNPGVPDQAIDQAMDALLALDAAKTLVQINEDKYKLLRDGVPVHVRWPDGRESSEKLTVIDFDRPDDDDRNEFICVQELWLEGGPAPIRPDLLCFVNGLPLVCVEFKRQDKELRVAFDDNYTRYREDLPALFAFNAVVVLSDGFDARFGTITSAWEHFYRWKRLNETDPDPAPKDDETPIHAVLPLLLRGMCLPANLLDLVENFTLFDRSDGEPLKIVARNHQYMGVNGVIANRDKDSAEIQRVFEELARLNDELNVEDRQYIAEGFDNEDQRAIYQLLCKEKTDLRAAEIRKIKGVAKELLLKLLGAKNQLQYLRDRAALQAQMRTEIFDYLFEQLPEAAYAQDEILGRSQKVFEHFYRRQVDGPTLH
jgi:type I restriction enzyme R subunit